MELTLGLDIVSSNSSNMTFDSLALAALTWTVQVRSDKAQMARALEGARAELERAAEKLERLQREKEEAEATAKKV